jgi:Lrp/AsnC family transcriptional regulator for asnA, asnC and gidA
LDARRKIDEVDVSILKTLLNNGRTNFSTIAKNLGMSSNAIRMRVKRLKKDGVINGAIMQVNPKSLGYNCISHLRIKTDANEEKSVYDFVDKIPEIIATFRPIGKFNINSIAVLKRTDELAHTVEQISSNPHVISIEESIWIDVIKMDHPENLVIEPFDVLMHTNESLSKDENSKTKKDPLHIGKGVKEKHLEESYDLDKIDQLIIKILSGNARMSFRKLAKKIGVSPQSVIKRYKKMRKTVLPFSSITLDLRKLGYIGTAVCYIKTSNLYTKSKVFEELLRIPNVIVASKCLGQIDIMLALPFKNLKDLYKVKKRISKTLGVKQLEIFVDKPFSRWPLNLVAQFFSNQI